MAEKQKKIVLSTIQKAEATSLFEEIQDLNELTRRIFKDDSLDGRSREGRALRSYLVSEGKTYNTTKSEKKKFVTLSEAHKQFLMSDQVTSKMKPLEIARATFQDDEIKPLSAEHRMIIDFLYKFRKDLIDETELLSDDKWHPPKSHLAVIRRINKWVGLNLDENHENLPIKNKKCVEKLLSYFRSYKLEAEINAYKTQSDRDLFESEFIRATWDKPDLTNDEINLYMMVSSNYVRKKHIQIRLDTFNNILEAHDMEGDGEISMKMSEYVKVTSEELNACEKRIDTLISKLNVDRAKRVEKAGANNANILALVEAFQNEEERTRMIKVAQLRTKLVKDEAERFESLDEFRARIFGIGIDELI